MQIYHILFPNQADAIIFSQWIIDFSDNSDAWEKEYGSNAEKEIDSLVEEESRALRFLLDNTLHYRHISVKDLKIYDHMDPATRRNRIVCYADDNGFDDMALIEKQMADRDIDEVSLVSFENECILSVYDDRGCDIVFATYEKMCEFYHQLKPFFHSYDMELMEKRYRKAE